MREDRFNPEDCATLEGELVCPKCGCCTLRHPKLWPSIFEQVDRIQTGEKLTFTIKEAEWECPGGCTNTLTHPK